VCTVVLSLAPAEPMPLLLLGFRDEFTGRPWQPPARHWPGSPLIGGRDEQAGGTWLAVHPGVRRVACVLNTRGQQAPPATRRSRGELPLRAAADGSVALEQLRDDPATLAHYDPFFLVCADTESAVMLSWDGARTALEHLGPATHVLTNAGHTFPSAHEDAKAAYFGRKFAAHRPDGDPAATIKDAWGDWLTLAAGDGLPDTDPAAIIVRHVLPDGRVYGTGSVSLVALGAGGLRYDFQPVPADPTTWYSVDLRELPSSGSCSSGPGRSVGGCPGLPCRRRWCASARGWSAAAYTIRACPGRFSGGGWTSSWGHGRCRVARRLRGQQ
jgi:hypothetical protein